MVPDLQEVTGLAFGSKARRIFEPGWMLIAIPWDWIPTMTRTLGEMDWIPAPFSETVEEFLVRFNRIAREVEEESPNP